MKNSIFSEVAILQSSTLRRMNYFEGIFKEFWSEIMEQILHRTYALLMLFLSKTTTDYLRNLSFLELCLHLVSTFIVYSLMVVGIVTECISYFNGTNKSNNSRNDYKTLNITSCQSFLILPKKFSQFG